MPTVVVPAATVSVVVSVGDPFTSVDVVGSGGATAGGTATVAFVRVEEPDGGTTAAAGGAVVSAARIESGGGGAVAGGAAEVTQGNDTIAMYVEGSGGASSGGTASIMMAVSRPASGGATASGSATVVAARVQAGSGGATAAGDATIVAQNQLAIVTESLPTAVLGRHYSFQLQFAGSGTTTEPFEPPVVEILSGTLPAGVTMDDRGKFTGSPTQVAHADITIKASAPGLAPATKALTFHVAANLILVDEDPVLSFATASALPPAIPGSNYEVQIVVAGVTGTLEVTLVSGSLPPSFTLTPSGALGGPVPTGVDATYAFRLRAADGIAAPIEQDFTLEISPTGQIVILTASPLPDAWQNLVYAPVQIVASGYSVAPTAAIASGSLPPGMAMSSNGWVSGNPGSSTAGGYTFRVRFENGVDLPAEKDFTLTLHANAAVTGDGGATAGGAATVVFARVETGSGGARSDGSAVVTTGVGTTIGTTLLGSGGAVASGSAVIAATPPLGGGAAFVTFIWRDGFVLTVPEGQDITVTHGYSHAGQTLNLAVGSENAPNGSPGVRFVVKARRISILNTGRSDPQNGASGGAGEPVFLRSLHAVVPGRFFPFGSLYGVRQTGDAAVLIDLVDPKNPARIAALSNAWYAPSRQFHMLDGGESIEYAMVYSNDPNDTASMPSGAAETDALAVVGLNTSRIAAYPMLEYTLNNFRHVGDGSDENPALQASSLRYLTKEAWLLGGATVQALPLTLLDDDATWNPPFGGAAVLTNWYCGMTPHYGDPAKFITPQYSHEAFWAIRYLRTGDVQALLRGREIMRKKIARGLNRQTQSSDRKSMWRGESIQTSTNASGSGLEKLQLHKEGTGGTGYDNAKAWDLGICLYRILFPADETFVDAFDRIVARWTAIGVATPTQNPGLNTIGMGTDTESRKLGNALWNMWWCFRACTELGETANAAAIRAKAVSIIENLYLRCHLSPASPAPKWLVHTNSPSTSPCTTTLPSAHGEGILVALCHWVVDENTNPTRLNWLKDVVQWAIENLTSTSGLAAGERRWAYEFQPDLSNGLTQVNNPPTQLTFQGFQECMNLALGPRAEVWWPGVYTTHFQELANHCFNHATGPDAYTSSNTGAISANTYNFSSWPKWNRLLAAAAWD